VRALTELEAPLSGARCVLYRVALTLWQRFLEGPELALGAPSRETAGAAFLLETDEGPVLVEPCEATVALGGALPLRLRLGRDPALDARLARLYGRLSRPAPDAAVRAREWRLEAGSRVRLAGWLSSAPHPRGAGDGYREPPRLPLVRASRLAWRSR